jgi:hypothetical protein
MKTVRGWWRRFREVSVSDRQVLALALACGAALAALVVVWLGMTTRTALLNRQLDSLYARQEELSDEINRTWTDIGEATAPQAMENRARRLGFEPASVVEYLIVPLEASETVTGSTVTGSEAMTVTATAQTTQ